MNNRGNQNWLPDVFGDFFDNNYMRRPSGTAPKIKLYVNVNDRDEVKARELLSHLTEESRKLLK